MDRKKLAIGAGVAAGVGGLVYLVTKAKPAPPEEEAPPEAITLDATWRTAYNDYGGFGGQLVTATITVDSPTAFTGELRVSSPGMVGIALQNYDEWQQEIARAEERLAECEGKTGSAYDTCVRGRTLHLERVRKKPQIDEAGRFYPTATYSERGTYSEKHWRYLDNLIEERKYTVSWPAGISSFDIAFFLMPDYLDTTYHRLFYLPKLYSPKVELYDGAGNLLASVIYEDAIEVVPPEELARPPQVDVPQQVRSGAEEEFWTEVSIWLAEKDLGVFLVDVSLARWPAGQDPSKLIEPGTRISPVGAIATCRFMDPDVIARKWIGYNAVPLDHTGIYTFTSFVMRDHDTGEYYSEPSRAARKKLPRVGWEPFAPGLYAVISTCKFKKISSFGSTWTKYEYDKYLWERLDTGVRIEVV